jgi:hypothetical protein
VKRIKFFLDSVKVIFVLLLIGIIFSAGYYFYHKYVYEKKILEQIVQRLKADSRIAQVLVSSVAYDLASGKDTTTIKFLEFDSLGNPLEPKYFTFTGNIIQFQSLVVRFADNFVALGDPLRGKSVYLFWKAFVLDGANTQEYIITPINEIPQGYKTGTHPSIFEQGIWKNFWIYALDPKKAASRGIKNAQIEAPGTKFVPGIVYTLKIEHDGGIRIDASEVPAILKGEKVL